MSTNEELVADARVFVDRNNGMSWQSVVGQLADALEQTTRELAGADEQIRDEIKVRELWVKRTNRARTTLTKVRHVYQTWLDHTAANPQTPDAEALDMLLSDISDALDESASRPAPAADGGWSTVDREAAAGEAEIRFGEWKANSDPHHYRYSAGSINGFILGAEWQKARTAAPAPIEAGEREALVNAIRSGAVEWDPEYDEDYPYVVEAEALADLILAAGFRRAPVEDANPYTSIRPAGFAPPYDR